jgi:serine/threonine-protein kinase SRPK3
VHLGDLLDGRKVLHKLGYGGFSTTWLVRDTVGIGFKAVKIVKAEETESSSEGRTLEHLASLETDHPGRNHLRRLTSHFILEGPNGRPGCLVMDVAGVSLQNLYNVPDHGYTQGARGLRADIAHTIARQPVEAVDFLHSRKICHGGIEAISFLLCRSNN